MTRNQNVVYLAAPKRLLSSDLYDRAFRYLLARSRGVMNPRWMFESNQDWIDNYQSRLMEANVMVIVTDDNLVGKGVYKEYMHFFERHCKIYLYDEEMDCDEEFAFEDEKCAIISSLIRVKSLKIVDENDWRDYATVKY